MTSGNDADSIAAVLRDGARNLRGRGPGVNEAATRSVLIDRVLEELGYPPTHRSPEDGTAGSRPDDLCFLQPVGVTPGRPALVIEAKRLDADFDRVPSGQARGYSPDRQIQRYLSNIGISGPSTIGVLTDGLRWRIYQRADNLAATDVEYRCLFDFSGLANPSQSMLSAIAATDRSGLDEFIAQLSRQAIAADTVPAPPPTPSLADGLLEAVSSNAAPQEILKNLLGEPNPITDTRLENADTLTGVRKDAHDTDWEEYAYAPGPELASDKPGLEGNRIPVGVVKFRHHPSQEISRGDVALYARTLASGSSPNAAVVFAYETAPDGAVTARMAASAAGQVNMTAGFDPALPSPSARAAIDQQLRIIRETSGPLTAERLLSPLAVATLRQQFYREVDHWTRAVLERSKDRAGREAVLRHLIRVMFAWILKEENRIPPEIFERAFNDTHLSNLDDYHREVLRFLFHHRLNVHYDRWDDHTIPGLNSALNQAPFLNGSLFAHHDGDDELGLEATDYWSVNGEKPGLFTILSRYHWTMDEHRPGESEQTLDPELLSNLFERLIDPTEEGSESPLRQPQGTYYTPADVADEMVKDALAAAVKDQAAPLDGHQLLELFGDSDALLPDMTPEDKERLAGRIRELRIFDPAVGSGEFLFSTLLALRRALKKLEDADEPAEAIIKRQLRGQDINPLAVQIARLRLFIAITATRKQSSSTPLPREFDRETEPLPNLEAVIVCADTLETVADPQWRNAQLDMANPEIREAVIDIAENRALWFDAHNEEAKIELLQEDDNRRTQLKKLLLNTGDLASPELHELAKSGLLSPGPAKTDARLLFDQNFQGGFDIVIGNPPYEALSKSMSAAARNRLAKDKLYRTTGGGDLYNLFCETALSLAKPDGGVVTLIVPLSIAFGRNKQTLRNVFNQRCKTISLRHYDNRPDTVFNFSPTVKSPENRQRATIITALIGDFVRPDIKSTELQSWPVEERQQCLRQRFTARVPHFNSSVDQRIAGQWPRIPTPEIAQLVETIAKQKTAVSKYAANAGIDLAFPKTAYHFVSSIPRDTVSPRSENLFTVASERDLRLTMAALNGHVGYGWWRVFGDGFHVNPHELTTITIPDAWAENPRPAIELGQKLIDAMPECLVENKQQGGIWRNVNFHLKPDLIAELDRLHIAALGLPEEPLLTHLRTMRSSSSWDYGVQ